MRAKNIFSLTSILAAMSLSAAWTYDGRVDFSVETGKVRPELHSSGFGAHINHIDSAVFTLSALSRFQTTPLDQAYFYGCGWRSWGYRNGDGTFNKVFYALKAFGRIAKDCGTLVKSEGNTDSLTFFGARSKDGKRDYLIACDFGGGRRTLEVDVSGVDSKRCPTVYAIDGANDLNPVGGFAWNGRRLVLTKCDINSAAFLVVFE